jgi:hypothetical protein
MSDKRTPKSPEQTPPPEVKPKGGRISYGYFLGVTFERGLEEDEENRKG